MSIYNKDVMFQIKIFNLDKENTKAKNKWFPN